MSSSSPFTSTNNLSNFSDFRLNDSLLKGIEAAGFKSPSDIQSKVIPIILQGQDLVAQAQTGTGKTAAFGLATMNLIDPSKKGSILILTPTRELCMQVADEMRKLGKFLGIEAVPVYGGTSGPKQIDQLNRGAQVIVATPGRLLDHLESKRIKNFAPSIVVLDEADQMVDMGFIDDMKKILQFVPKQRQTLLFSATMPDAILKFCKEFLQEPAYINISKKFEANENIDHWYHLVEHHKKLDVLSRLIDFHNPHKAIIFCKTKKDVEQVRERLTHLRSEFVHALHGDMEQRHRERVIEDFKNGKISILVATDIAARGLNILDISHVFNFHPPFDKENYVHRIGRTARAGNLGTAISLVSNAEKRSFEFVQKSLGQKITHKPLPTQEEQKELALAKLLQELESTDVTEGIIKLASSQFQQVSQLKEKLLLLLLKNKGYFNTENFKNFAVDERSHRDGDSRGYASRKRDGDDRGYRSRQRDDDQGYGSNQKRRPAMKKDFQRIKKRKNFESNDSGSDDFDSRDSGRKEFESKEFSAKSFKPKEFSSRDDDRKEYRAKSFKPKEYDSRDSGRKEFGVKSFKPKEFSSRDGDRKEFGAKSFKPKEFGAKKFGSRDSGRKKFASKEFGEKSFKPKEFKSKKHSS